MKEVLGMKLYTLTEVGQLIGTQRATVGKYVQEGKIPTRIIGGKKYVSEEGLKKFLLTSDK